MGAVPVPLGTVAVSVVELTTLTLVAETAPNLTVAPATKPAPLIVTALPPEAGPLAGVTAETVGTVTGSDVTEMVKGVSVKQLGLDATPLA
jgi:hypothetical protein